MPTPIPYSIAAAAILFGYLPTFAADPAVITHIAQRPWILNAAGVLKSETELTIENHCGQAVDVWVKIRVPGKPDSMESLGSLPMGTSKRVVHVPELTTDGDPVSFAIHDNQAGNTAPIGAKTLPQKKIRHWRLYVGHNSHMDIGYTEFQEDLKTKTWPGFWDQALLEDMPRSDSWPDDAKVRLEVEAVYQLDTSLLVRRVHAHEKVEANKGKVALMRGPIVYCLEGVDNKDVDLFKLSLSRSAELSAEHRATLLGGVTVIQPRGLDENKTSVQLTAIPYFAWANREKGPMTVWINECADEKRK